MRYSQFGLFRASEMNWRIQYYTWIVVVSQHFRFPTKTIHARDALVAGLNFGGRVASNKISATLNARIIDAISIYEGGWMKIIFSHQQAPSVRWWWKFSCWLLFGFIRHSNRVRRRRCLMTCARPPFHRRLSRTFRHSRIICLSWCIILWYVYSSTPLQ